MNAEKRAKLTTKAAIKFSQLSNAQNFAARTKSYSPKMIIMGDDGLYWALPMGLAQFLTKFGYEIA